MSELNCNSSPHLITLVKDHWTTWQGVKINFTVQVLWSISVKIIFPIYITLFRSFSSSLLMKTSCLRLKLVELNFLVSFNTDDQSKTDVANTANIITYKTKSSRWTFSMWNHCWYSEIGDSMVYWNKKYSFCDHLSNFVNHCFSASWQNFKEFYCFISKLNK